MISHFFNDQIEFVNGFEARTVKENLICVFTITTGVIIIQEEDQQVQQGGKASVCHTTFSRNTSRKPPIVWQCCHPKKLQILGISNKPQDQTICRVRTRTLYRLTLCAECDHMQIETIWRLTLCRYWDHVQIENMCRARHAQFVKICCVYWNCHSTEFTKCKEGSTAECLPYRMSPCILCEWA